MPGSCCLRDPQGPFSKSSFSKPVWQLRVGGLDTQTVWKGLLVPAKTVSRIAWSSEVAAGTEGAHWTWRRILCGGGAWGGFPRPSSGPQDIRAARVHLGCVASCTPSLEGSPVTNGASVSRALTL